MVYGTVQRRREKKLAEILDVALELVGEGGLEALTVAKLAKRMEWTKGAMYRYFASKDQLVAALNARVIEGWSEVAEGVLAAHATASATDRVLAVLDTWVDLAHDQPAQFGLVSLTLAEPRNLVENIEDATHIPAMMAMLGRIVTLVAEAMHNGEIAPSDPFQRTLSVVFATFGVLQLKKLARWDAAAFDTRTLARRTSRDLMAAWAVEES